MIIIPLKGGHLYEVHPLELEVLQAAFPRLNVYVQTCRAAAWAFDHEGRRKTVRGVKAYLHGWMRREMAGHPRLRRAPLIGPPGPPPRELQVLYDWDLAVQRHLTRLHEQIATQRKTYRACQRCHASVLVEPELDLRAGLCRLCVERVEFRAAAPSAIEAIRAGLRGLVR